VDLGWFVPDSIAEAKRQDSSFRQWGTSRFLYHRPSCWDRLESRMGVAAVDSPVLFMHERTAAGGKPRLVTVEMRGWYSDYRHADAAYYVLELGNGFTAPRLLNTGRVKFDDDTNSFLRYQFLFNDTAYYAGQPVADSTSSFTIRVGSRREGAKGILDGELLADDTVVIRVRRP
jgi:hypothetical protein